MKNYYLSIIAILSSLFTLAQNPVKLSIESNKKSEKVYEVRIKATIDNGWHIYAQKQPNGSIGIPAKIIFSKNPLVTLDGPVKEIGKLEADHNEVLGITQYQYSKQVEFVQVIKVKANVKTNLTCKVTYQACTNERCLQPMTENFSIIVK